MPLSRSGAVQMCGFIGLCSLESCCSVMFRMSSSCITFWRLMECISYLCTYCLHLWAFVYKSASWHKCTTYRCVSVPVVSEVRQSNELAVRLAGRERAKWRHIGAGIVLLRCSTGRLMRKFSHRGLSIKNNNCKRWKKKTDLITISARKKQFSIRLDSYVPWGLVQNRGRSVGEDRVNGRWGDKEMKEKQQL